MPQDAYDELADSYAERIDTKPHNAHYDRPALQSLLHDLEGRNVLDAACGPGAYTEWLLGRGAKVTGLDANAKMLEHAIERNGDRARFIQANIEEPLSMFGSGSFDGIVSPLTINYCADLRPVFSEFSRILKKDGWFVFSTEHPFFTYTCHELENYRETREVQCVWHGFGKPVVMKSYHHSLETITEALADNGFVIERLLEALPTDRFREAEPEDYEKLLKFPAFIFMRAVKR